MNSAASSPYSCSLSSAALLRPKFVQPGELTAPKRLPSACTQQPHLHDPRPSTTKNAGDLCVPLSPQTGETYFVCQS